MGRYARIPEHIDWGIILCVVAILCMGLMCVYSSTQAAGPSIFFRQLLWVGIGTVFLILAFAVDYRHFMYLSWPLYFFVLFGLVVVLVLGREISGARRWMSVGPFSVQPSEFVKILVIVWLAYWAEKKRDIPVHGFRDLIFPALVVGVPIVLILVQPDLGTAGLVAFIACAMFLMLGIKRSTLIVLGILAVVSLPVSWFLLKDYQKMRVLSFIDPSRDPLGSGYHAIQSKIAVGSGGLMGKGFLHGTQTQLNFLPEHHTDFIFSVVAEEWGFLGSTALLVLYLILITKIIDVGLKAKDRFGALLCFGIATYFTFHVFINVSMAIGMFPVVGVPLPFVSYGGTFMLINLICTGIVLNVAWRRFIF